MRNLLSSGAMRLLRRLAIEGRSTEYDPTENVCLELTHGDYITPRIERTSLSILGRYLRLRLVRDER